MNSPLRSLLFVPGDSERKQAKALTSAADAVILDLEDSVAAAQRPAARARIRLLLQSRTGAGADSRRAPHGEGRGAHEPELWVRLNAPSSGQFLEDLAAVFPGAPAGLVLPKISGAAEIVQVDRDLAALETRDSRSVGSTRLIVICTETPQAVLSLPSYAQALASEPAAAARIAALTWGSEDLSAALGASGKVDADGAPAFTFQLARSLCLLAAAAIGVQAIDGVCVDFRSTERLQREAGDARRDGFTGKLAIHPDQIATINSAFSPSEPELARARRIVAAFAASPEAGALSLDGEMIDRPHLLQARRILGLSPRGAEQAVKLR